MSALKPITVAGGGVAGLALGIGLRRRGIPVTVWEAGHYPRHRVCGEFISGRGQEVLARLGLLEPFFQAGASPAHTAAFCLLDARSPVRPLPVPALCLSRFLMDALLARLFLESGGELRENQRWCGPESPEGLVLANGRRLQPSEGGWRWFGLKVHARGVPLAADLEMHALSNGYIGLCRLGPDEVNVCGLFRRSATAHGLAPPRAAILRGAPGTSAWERLEQASFEEASFCSVAGLCLRPQRAAASAQCRLGDALTLIPPVTGNGMSMAFEAAELALEPLAAYSRGQIPWARARQGIARACDAAFARRLAWARWLQWMMFTPLLQGPLAALPLRSAWLWRSLFERTR